MANLFFPATNRSGRSEKKSKKQQPSELPAGVAAMEMEARTEGSELEAQPRRPEMA